MPEFRVGDRVRERHGDWAGKVRFVIPLTNSVMVDYTHGANAGYTILVAAEDLEHLD